VTLSRCQVSRSSRTITAIFVSKRMASSMPGEGRPLLYVRDVTRGTVVRAWVPDVPGIAEAFHTRFTDHVYPPHAHDTWTLMIVDDGVVRYDLHRHERGAPSGTVVLLPPDIAHTDRSATPAGFRKRVLYLDADVVDTALAGRVVDEPTLADDLLHTRLDQLHRVLDEPDGALEAESRLALIGDRIARRLGRPPSPRPPGLAQALRDLLDSRLADGVTLRDAGALLHADPAHLVRSFGPGSSASLRTATSSGGGWRRRAGCSTASRSRTSRPPSATTRRTCTGTSPGWSGSPRAGSPLGRDRPRTAGKPRSRNVIA
jgi:hypothetical protein